MERIINLLVEYDKAGQELVREAQKKRGDELGHLDDYKNKMRREYEERSHQRVEKYRLQAEQEKAQQLAELKKQHEARLAALRKQFDENNGHWMAEIVQRCING